MYADGPLLHAATQSKGEVLTIVSSCKHERSQVYIQFSYLRPHVAVGAAVVEAVAATATAAAATDKGPCPLSPPSPSLKKSYVIMYIYIS